MQPLTLTPDSNHSGVDQLWGWSIKEDAAAAASIEFRKAAIDGDVVFYLELSSGQSATIVFPTSVDFEGGIYIKEVTGSVTGILLVS